MRMALHLLLLKTVGASTSAMRSIITMLAKTADGAMLVENGNIVFWNQAAERLLGLKAEEAIGRPCHAILHGQTLGGRPLCCTTCRIGSRVAAGRAVRNFDMQIQTKSGRTVWLNVSLLPIPSRKPGRFLAAHLFRDITKQIRVRRLASELYTALCIPVEGAADGTVADPERTKGDVAPDLPPTLPLSQRERDVLGLLAAGTDTKTMADRLCISSATVRNHIQHILEKLGAHTRLEALAMAFHRHPSS